MDTFNNFRIARSMGSVATLVSMAREEGLDTAVVLAGSGIDPATLDNPQAEIDGAQELRVMENLLRLGVEPSFAFRAGMRYRISVYGMLGYAMLSSATMRDAVQLCSRFLPLTYGFGKTRLEEAGNEVRIFFECDLPSPELRAFVIERDMATVATISRDLTGKRLPLQRWWMTHAQRAPLTVYRQAVNGTPEFDMPANQWIFDRSGLDFALPLANRLTCEQCVRACEELLERRQALTSFRGRIHDYLLLHSAQMPSLETAARCFHLTPRTLRRRLADEATSYRDLVEEVRRELAEALLREGRMTVQQIAARLGYRDVGSFTTAFRRWTDTTPAHFRRTPDER